MSKFIVELFLDGYETDADHEAACIKFIEEQLDFSGSSVKVTVIDQQSDKPESETP